MSSTEIEEGSHNEAASNSNGAAKRNVFARIVLFIQQVIAELKKVVTPTRKELINYTLVVLGFVVVMMALVWVLDQAFGFVTIFIFGSIS